MKYLAITIVSFFIIVNTAYYWEPKLGVYTMLATLILLVAYLFLGLSFVRQLYRVVEERFQNRNRIGLVCLMAVILAITSWRPRGIINFKTFEAKNVLVAGAEGAANCQSTISLRADHSFVARVTCFGVQETRGRFEVRNDTVFFKGSTTSRGDDEFYSYAVVKKSKFRLGENKWDLVCYLNTNDTLGKYLRLLEGKLPIK